MSLPKYIMDEIAEKDTKFRKNAIGFTFELIKVITQTGYYSPDHPLTFMAMKELYKKFSDFSSLCGDICYSITNLSKKEDIEIITSNFPSFKLTELFQGFAREHFLNNFFNLFENLGIVAITIKKDIQREDFERFLELSLAWQILEKSYQGMGKEFDSITESIIEKKISSISIIHRTDLIIVDADIPVPVHICLANVKKSFKMNKELRRMHGTELLLKLEGILSEYISPISDIEHLSKCLINIEHVSSGLSFLKGVDIEGEILKKLSDISIVSALRNLLKKWNSIISERKDSRKDTEILIKEERLRKLIRRLSLRLFDNPHEEVNELLKDVFNLEMIQFQELPLTVQESVRNVRLTDQFLQKHDEFLNDFKNTLNREDYRHHTENFSKIIPELFKREEFKKLSNIMKIFEEHLADPSPELSFRGEEICELILRLKTEKLYNNLISLIQTEEKEVRNIAGEWFFLFGKESSPYLIDILVKTEDLSVRREIFSTLVRLANLARPYIEEELGKFNLPWFALMNLISILGEIGEKISVQFITPYLAHEHPRVREECAISLTRLLGDESESFLILLLKDKDFAVRRRAITCLSSLKSENVEFFRFIIEVLRRKLKKDEIEEDKDLQLTCARALLNYETAWKVVSPRLEIPLMEAIQQETGLKSLFSRGKYHNKPAEVRDAIIEALGTIGTEKSVTVLEKLKSDPDKEIEDKVWEAIERILKRLKSF